MQKVLWIFLALALMIGAQAGAKVGTMTGVESQCVAVDNAEIPKAPPVAFGATDEVVFFEDFESGAVGWEYWDLTDVSSWHVDDFNAYSGNSWWCGDSMWNGYFNLWLQYLVTPTLDLSVTSNAQLSFKVRWAMESTTAFPPPPPYDGWDGCNVWISTDNGTSWDVIEPISPAYTCTDLSSFTIVWGFDPGIAGWADSSGGWQDASVIARATVIAAVAHFIVRASSGVLRILPICSTLLAPTPAGG